MPKTNPKSFLDALHVIVSSDLGKLLIGAIVWSMSFAYAAGALRNEVESLSRRLLTIEQKVDTIDDLVRRQANLPSKTSLLQAEPRPPL